MKKNDLTQIALSLGGNLGDVKLNFDYAVSKFKENGFREIRISSLYKTKPVECPPDSPDFINAAMTAKCPISVQGLFILCKHIEAECGRDMAGERNTPRPLDIDIIIYGDMVFSDGKIQVPHKEAKNRLFVLIPLNEIAPSLISPDTGETVSEIIRPFKTTELYKIISKNKLKFA